MKSFPSSTLVLALTVVGLSIGTARACGGFVEAPIACDDPSPTASAEYMLKRVSAALAADKTKAFDMFTHGVGGFRTADTYVFCVGPDGVMSAHPNPILQGHDVRDLHDKTGNYFIRTMLETAKPDQVSVIRYLFPKPGSTIAVPKTTYYTKAGDQTCAVGVYDGDDGNTAQAATPLERVAQLRQKLDAEIPQSARGDWTAFLEALNASRDEQVSAMAEARKRLKAVEVALSPSPGPKPASDADQN